MDYGFIKVASAIPSVKVGDVNYNTQQIEKLVSKAENQGVEIIVFPELAITSYTCQDLFRQDLLLNSTEEAIQSLLIFTQQLDIIVVVGAPIVVGNLLLNCAVIIQKGHILGIIPKTYLPNYNEFYEKRWFASSQDLRPTIISYAGHTLTISAESKLFLTSQGVKFGVEICEDVWAPIPPSNHLALSGADLILNLSATDELLGKHKYLKSLLAQQSARMISGYVYSSCGFGESTQDVVYGGNALIYENGTLLAEGERFSVDSQLVVTQIDVERLRAERRNNTTFVNAQRAGMLNPNEELCYAIEQKKPFHIDRTISPCPFIPEDDDLADSCEEVFNIQVMGLAKRLIHTGCKHVVLGVSGGLDSTLALLVCVRTFDKLKLDRKGIIGVTMPGFGTTDRTYQNAIHLMEKLNISIREISIAKSVTQHFEDIGHDMSVHDITYENGQARERTQILMDLSNQVGGFVIGTGDLSELALGWATYNGDHMSMYGVNASVPKTLIQHLMRFVATTMSPDIASILIDIVDTPISPELLPATQNDSISQKTEDLVGPYELHDFFLYYFLRYGFRPKKIFILAEKAFAGQYDDKCIKKWLTIFFRRFFSQQFKRSCLPDGPKVGSVSLSPRGDWRMPSDASNSLWLKECEEL